MDHSQPAPPLWQTAPGEPDGLGVDRAPPSPPTAEHTDGPERVCETLHGQRDTLEGAHLLFKDAPHSSFLTLEGWKDLWRCTRMPCVVPTIALISRRSDTGCVPRKHAAVSLGVLGKGTALSTPPLMPH